MKRRWKEIAGFTLVELIVVIAILGILAGVAVPTYNGYIKKANLAADQTLLDSINTAFAVACLENQKDINNLGSTPVLKITDSTGVLDVDGSTLVDDVVKAAFGRYLGGEAKFKVLKNGEVVFRNGMFVIKDENVRMTAEQLQAALEGSNYSETEGDLRNVLLAVDAAGSYFGAGFSLDALVAEAPIEVQEAFGFGTFDLTDAQLDAYLTQYNEEYAALNSAADKEAWIEAHENEVNTIRGNAYVMHIANDANGRNAATVLGDVTKMMNVMNTPVTPQQVIDYYNELYDPDTTNYTTAQAALQLTGVPNSAEMVVAMANSGTKNNSGISTLGSMYALAAGFYNSDDYTGRNFDDELEKLAQFDIVMEIMRNPGFSDYLTNGDAEKDIGAYLGAMTYLSQSELDMSQGGLFSGAGLQLLWSALGN